MRVVTLSEIAGAARLVTDESIRRACGFAGLGTGVMMLAFSFDLGMAFRAGGVLLALLCFALLVAAWRVRRDSVRRTEAWTLLVAELPAARQPEHLPETLLLLSHILRERLIWHAERVAVVALVFLGAALLVRFLAP
jgi:Ca2+/Na+ antiporter